MGKTLADAEGEVGRGIESVEAAAAIPHLMKGENLEGIAGGVDVEMVRQPVGVVAAITPFNFPAMIPLWFLPFALATGNAFILKPSERDPRPSQRIFELLEGTGAFPPGVANLLHGDRAAVEGLLDHPEVDAVSFVGQASTARLIASRCAQNGKRSQALGGAKNALVVMPDADLGKSVPAIMGSAFGAAGQRCLAGSVAVLVGDRERQDEVRAALAAAAADLVAGPGADEDTDVCPMVSPEARERAEAFVARSAEAGDELVLDGRVGGGEAGAMLRPTLIETADRESDLAREEIFGPVLAVVRADDLDDALDFVNGSRYGNAGSIFTQSGAAVREYRARAEAGMLGVNIGVPAPGRLVPVLGLEGLLRRRPARERHRRGRVLHAQEGRHIPLVNRLGLIAAAAICSALIAGCGGDSPTSGGGSGGSGSGSDAAAGAGNAAESNKDTDWPIFGRIPARTHYLDDPGLNPPLRQVWEYSEPTLLEFPPALVNNRLYVADKSGDVNALDAKTGKVVWSHKRSGPNGTGRQPADVTAPLFADGYVIIAFEHGEVIALEPDKGKLAWTTQLSSRLESSPIEIDGRVYLGSDSGDLWALDLKTGRADSVFTAEGSIKASPSYDAGKVYVGDYAGHIHAVDADSGKALWSADSTTTSAGGSGGFYSSPSIADGRVYAARDDGVVFAFDADTGKYLWNFTAGGRIYGSPAVAPGPGGDLTVFIGSYDANLYALAADSGKQSWSEKVGPVPGTATVIGDTVYTSSFKTDQTVGFDTASHKQTFKYPSPGYTPMLSDGKRLYLAGYASIHAFRPKRH